MTDAPNQLLIEGPLSESDYATWEELTVPQQKTKQLASGKWIKYLSFIPLDKLVSLQVKYRLSTPAKDMLGYFSEILQYIMVSPACRTPESARAALKGNAGVLLNLIGEMVNAKSTEEVEAELAKNS